MIAHIDFDPRAQGDALPIPKLRLTFSEDFSMAGHTAVMVIEGVGEIDAVVSEITANSALLTFTPTAEVRAIAAGEYAYAVIVDRDEATLRQTVFEGIWPVVDYPG